LNKKWRRRRRRKCFLSGEKGDAEYNDREQKRGGIRGEARVASCFSYLAGPFLFFA